MNLAKDYQSRGLATVAISSNSVKTHPQDGPEEMAADAQAFGKPPCSSLQVAMGSEHVMSHSVHGFTICDHRRHSISVREHACPQQQCCDLCMNRLAWQGLPGRSFEGVGCSVEGRSLAAVQAIPFPTYMTRHRRWLRPTELCAPQSSWCLTASWSCSTMVSLTQRGRPKMCLLQVKPFFTDFHCTHLPWQSSSAH